jgi:hypothetical protein
VVYRIGSAVALISLNNWNAAPSLLWRLFGLRDVLCLHLSVKHNYLLFKTANQETVKLNVFRLKSRMPSLGYLEVTFQFKVTTSGVLNLVYGSLGA